MTTKDTPPQSDSQADTPAGQPATTSTDTDTTPGSEHGTEPDDSQDDGHDSDNPSREAARYRRRLREAERERDELRTLLDATRQNILDTAASAAGLNQRHLSVAEITIESLLGDDGLIDHAKLRQSITTAADEFGLTRGRPPRPNPQQGTGGGEPHGAASWSKALKGN